MGEPARRARRRLPTWGKALMAVAAPVVFLALLELGLAVGGYRGTGPLALYDRFSRRKPAGTVRIAVVGASSAGGMPFAPKGGPVPFLRVLLRDAVPGQRTEVLRCTVNAVTSEGVRLIVERLAEFHVDVLIVYTGHNEFFSMPGLHEMVAAWDPEPPPWPLGTRTAALLRDMAAFVRGGPPPDDVRTRAERALAGQIASPGDYRPDTLVPAFRDRLRETIEIARRGGMRVLLCTLASNIRDCPPNRPRHRSGLPDEPRAAWRGHYERGDSLAKAGQHAAALEAFGAAAAIDDHHAGLLYAMGRSHLALGNPDAARNALTAARDRDYLPMRATSPRNDEAITGVAAAMRVAITDVRQAFEDDLPGGVPGDEHFVDHVHLTLRGAWTLARCWAKALERHKLLGESAAWDWSRARSREACEQALGLTDHDRAVAHRDMGIQYAVAEAGGVRVTEFRRPQLVESFRARGATHFAKALELDPSAVRELLTQFEPWGNSYVALGYIAAGQPDPAVKICQEILDVAPGFALAYEVLAMAHAARGDEEAVSATRRRLEAILASPDGGENHSGNPGGKERRR